MSLSKELFQIVDELRIIVQYKELIRLSELIKPRVKVIESVKKAHSGSWIGYHANVYQNELEHSLGAYFDHRWGFEGERAGEWTEYDPDTVKRFITSQSGSYDFSSIVQKAAEFEDQFEELKSTAISIIETYLVGKDDAFLARKRDEIELIKPLSASDLVQLYRPNQTGCSDSRALNSGYVVPPHVEMTAELNSLLTVFSSAKQMKSKLGQAASHLERLSGAVRVRERIGTNVAIGHGRSPLWRELKDFIKDRMSLPFDEFNRVPVAGMTNTARLIEMLDAAAVAFLVMTAEDETKEGKAQARMNVIHEVGLFQGRLGFTKAIILLEEGCEEFSNVQGLGQIRFPVGNIKATFEEVREVLEREGLAE